MITFMIAFIINVHCFMFYMHRFYEELFHLFELIYATNMGQLYGHVFTFYPRCLTINIKVFHKRAFALRSEHTSDTHNTDDKTASSGTRQSRPDGQQASQRQASSGSRQQKAADADGQLAPLER